MVSIVWFKTDLRLHDNETLVRAVEQSDFIVPVYCLDDQHFEQTQYGCKKTGAFRAQFLLESLQNLDDNLRKLGSGLIVVKGNPEVEIPKIALKYKVDKVFTKKEIAYEELNLHHKVEQALWKIHIPIDVFSTSTLYHAKDLPFAVKEIPEVFTQFRKKVESESIIQGVFDIPKSIKSASIEKLNLPKLSDLGLVKQQSDNRSVIHFKGGEEEAMKRLHHYFFETKSLSTYFETRNEMIGANYSSKFSPWLAMGCISPRYIYEQIKIYESKHGSSKSTYWLIFELLWRDYFRFMMKKHQHQFFLYHGLKTPQENKSKIDVLALEQWKNGTTGNKFVDANMIELNKTGFMSNRGRQNVASYFCHQLKMDWRYGAAYFEEQLIDYDVCSNWGNWMYIAGVGNDPRENRIFNLEKQANTYDINGAYRRMWLDGE